MCTPYTRHTHTQPAPAIRLFFHTHRDRELLLFHSISYHGFNIVISAHADIITLFALPGHALFFRWCVRPRLCLHMCVHVCVSVFGVFTRIHKFIPFIIIVVSRRFLHNYHLSSITCYLSLSLFHSMLSSLPLPLLWMPTTRIRIPTPFF